MFSPDAFKILVRASDADGNPIFVGIEPQRADSREAAIEKAREQVALRVGRGRAGVSVWHRWAAIESVEIRAFL